MQQLLSVLRNYILWDSHRRTGALANETCAGQIVFWQSDTLIYKNLGRMNRGYSLSYLLQMRGVDVAIVSSGAHIANDRGFESMLTYVRSVARRFSNISLIWKTQNPAGCGWDAPLSALPDENSSFWSSATHPRSAYASAESPFYNHRKFVGWDAKAKRFFQDTAVQVLDLTPFHYRADAHPSSKGAEGRPRGGSQFHGDCMHLCYGPDGGPLGLMPRLLWHQIETNQIRF